MEYEFLKSSNAITYVITVLALLIFFSIAFGLSGMMFWVFLILFYFTPFYIFYCSFDFDPLLHVVLSLVSGLVFLPMIVYGLGLTGLSLTMCVLFGFGFLCGILMFIWGFVK